MLFVCLIPMLFSVLVLAAHFLRTGPMILAMLCLIVPLTLFVRRMWALRLVQLFLLLGAAEWLRTLIVLVRDRQAQGEPWFRLVIILGVVVAFTAGSPFILQAKKVRKHFGATLAPLQCADKSIRSEDRRTVTAMGPANISVR